MKSTIVKTSNLENIHSLKNNFFHDGIMEKSVKFLKNQLEEHFIEGLKLKGFEFNNRFELNKFIKENCRCEDNIDLKERIYYVKNIPFFVHIYKISPPKIPKIINKKFNIILDLGIYAYL